MRLRKNWVYALALGIAMFMCGASYADQYSTGMGISSPAYGDDFTLTTWPPLAPANRPADTGPTYVAMATDNDKYVTDNCMAGCHVDERTHSLISYYRMHVDSLMPETVLACGYESKNDRPMKVPIRV